VGAPRSFRFLSSSCRRTLTAIPYFGMRSKANERCVSVVSIDCTSALYITVRISMRSLYRRPQPPPTAAAAAVAATNAILENGAHIQQAGSKIHPGDCARDRAAPLRDAAGDATRQLRGASHSPVHLIEILINKSTPPGSRRLRPRGSFSEELRARLRVFSRAWRSETLS
jgi:hypothetical protein